MPSTLFQNRFNSAAHLPASGSLAHPTTSFFTEQRVVIGIILASICYQALLCLVNTQVHIASRALVGLSEAVIIAACLPILARRLLPGTIMLLLLISGLLVTSSLFSGDLNIKAFRDLLIPICFFWVGYNVGNPKLAERGLIVASIVILIFGFFELFFVDQFTRFFDIFGYYVSTGNLAPITDYVRESKLQLNGIRPEGIGRTLFPGLLGSHRVSSVFLEPISMGNFATMCAAWGLSKGPSEYRKMALFVGIAFVMMVLSDSRFALMAVSLMVIARIVLKGSNVNLAILAPFLAIALLLVLGLDATGRGSDSFQGRLAFSGFTLMSFDLPMIFGVGGLENFADQGYAYVISSFGLPICLLLWFSFWILKMPDDEGTRFRAFVAIYFSLILCISGNSAFAFKSSAVLWLLFGCTLRNPAPLNKSNNPQELKNA
ncbi:MAG: polysaccharide biosynthesis protein GumE [Gammaproteobacteria bacterium]|nr:MAG: polysaccharide biosynthesis protein GumE [Gammaproteobacteria bacterium]